MYVIVRHPNLKKHIKLSHLCLLLAPTISLFLAHKSFLKKKKCPLICLLSLALGLIFTPVPNALFNSPIKVLLLRPCKYQCVCAHTCVYSHIILCEVPLGPSSFRSPPWPFTTPFSFHSLISLALSFTVFPHASLINGGCLQDSVSSPASFSGYTLSCTVPTSSVSAYVTGLLN